MASDLSGDTVVRIVPEHVSAGLEDEAVVLHLGKGVYYGLNNVASDIWQLIGEAPHTVDEIHERLVAEYEVEPEKCRTDLMALLAELLSENLIEIDS